MKPLVVLIVAFVLTVAGIQLIVGSFDYRLAGRIAIAVMLAFTAIGHFAFTKGMEMMLPEWLPFKKGMVIATGGLEILGAIGLLMPGFEKETGWMLILFFILIVPANISAAIRHIDYQKGTYEGPGVKYLWFRVPLQVFFIVWVYLCVR
jgi:uncharacterized membrane protein